MTQTTETHTAETLDRMEQDERWLGFGYIGHRRNGADETGGYDTSATDALALDMANAAGMTYDEFFQWANSKDGRWFGDCSDNLDMARRYGPRR